MSCPRNDSSSSSKSSNMRNAKIWQELVHWVVHNEDDATATTTIGSTTSNSNGNSAGYVHPALALQGSGTGSAGNDGGTAAPAAAASSCGYRGVFATTAISQGEVLIQIPASRTLHGDDGDDSVAAAVPEEAGTSGSSAAARAPAASPWLHCVGALLRARKNTRTTKTAATTTTTTTKQQSWFPYLNSLPTDYATCLSNWSTEQELRPFLQGTTLGALVMEDRIHQTTQQQYQTRIVPYLRHLGLLEDNEEGMLEAETAKKNYQAFVEASMCISTRGFHVLPTTASATETKKPETTYDGPFLIPVMDLLNHNPEHACTTLRRIPTTTGTNDGTNTTTINPYCFTMVAERDIQRGEEVCHSYGTALTATQLLHTFGFVPIDYTERLVTTSTSSSTTACTTTTPVCLHKQDHVLTAARILKTASTLPAQWQHQLKARTKNSDDDENDDEECLYWDVAALPERSMDDIIPNDDFLVPSLSSALSSLPASSNNPDITTATTTSTSTSSSTTILTEDIITLVIGQFLPDEAYEDIFPTKKKTEEQEQGTGDEETAASPVRLDRSILLEDTYLGLLVCSTLLLAIQLKLNNYNIDDTNKIHTTPTNKAFGSSIGSSSSSSVLGRRLQQLCTDEKERIQTLLLKSQQQQHLNLHEQREVYGRTIRLEEMLNLDKLYHEISTLMNNCLSSLNDNNNNKNHHNNDDRCSLSASQLPPTKKVKSEVTNELQYNNSKTATLDEGDGVSLVPLTPDLAEEALVAISECFPGRSPVATQLGRTSQDYARIYGPSMVRWAGNDLGMAAVDAQGRILGVVTAEDFADTEVTHSDPSGQLDILGELLGQLEQVYRQRHALQTAVTRGQHLHIYLVAVRPEAAGKALSKRLLRRVLEVATTKGFMRAFAETSGSRMLHIFRTVGFDETYRVDWSRAPHCSLASMEDKAQALVELALGT